MSTDERTIEFLAPRDGAFGESGGADFVGFDDDEGGEAFGDDGPRSRWLTALAVLGVTGLLAGGVIAAAPWDSPQEAAPSTTKAPPATIAPPPSSTQSSVPSAQTDVVTVGPPGWLLSNDFDESWQLAFGFSDADGRIDDGVLEIWATPGATRTSGVWVAVTALDYLQDHARLNATRITIDTNEATVSTAVDGVAEVQWTSHGLNSYSGQSFSLQSYGLELADLLQLAESVTFDGTSLDYGSSILDIHTAASRLERVVSSGFVGSFAPSVDRVATLATYIDPETGRFLQVTSGPSSPSSQAVFQFLMPTDERFGNDGLIAVLASTGVRTAQIRSYAGFAVARFVDEDEVVTVAAFGFDADELVTVLNSLYRADVTEWRDAITNPDPTEWSSTSLGTPASEDDLLWSAETVGKHMYLGSEGSGAFVGFDPVAPAEITSYSSPSMTFVMARVPPDDARRSFRVLIEGSETLEVQLVEMGPGLGRAGVVAFAETAPYVVEWNT